MRCRRVVLLLFLPLLLVGCRAGGRGGEGEPASVESAVQEDASGFNVPFEPVFTAAPIPPEVEARMRGCSYPADARIPLSELRYLRLSYVDFDGAP